MTSSPRPAGGASRRASRVSRVDAAYLARFEPRRVGGEGIDGLWVPAEELDHFNAHIAGVIEVVAELRA